MFFCFKNVDILFVGLTIFLNPTQGLINSCSYIHDNNNTVLVSALLAIHNGPDCSTIQLRGIQQMAALIRTTSKINDDLSMQEGIHLKLQIHDTCSTPEGAVKAGLRALVENGQTCQHPPLFLGFLGLENYAALKAVYAITKQFNATHILPYAIESSHENAIHVAEQNYKEQAKTVLAVVHELHWKVLCLAFEDKAEALAKELLQSMTVNSSLCLRGTVTRLTNEKVNEKFFTEKEGTCDGLIVLADNPEIAVKLFKVQSSMNVPLLILINKVGLRSWQIPKAFTNLFILQKTSASFDNLIENFDHELLEEYNNQEHTKCIEAKNSDYCETLQASNTKLSSSVDASVAALSHGVRLLGSGLRVAHRLWCRKSGEEVSTPGLCPRLQTMILHEWPEFIRRANSFSMNVNSSSVGAHMNIDLSASYNLYNMNASGKLEKIGNVRKALLSNISGFNIPKNQRELTCPSHNHVTQLPVQSNIPQSIHNTTLLDNLELFKEYSGYQLIGLISGVGLGMLLVMIVIILGVYNMFRVRTGRSGKSSSINTSPSIRRQHRGSVMSNRSV